MPRIPRPYLNKIPGDYMPIAEKEVYTKDLKALTHLELKDLKTRQEKLLFNKKQLELLPDKGQRIKELYENILDELDRRTNVEEAAKLFSNLNIASSGQKQLDNLEWNGKLCNENHITLDVLDSDDESDIDPLRILAQNRMHERQIRIIKSEPNLITEDDIKEIESFKLEGLDSGIQTQIEHSSSPINVEIINIDIQSKFENLKTKLSLRNSKLTSNRSDQKEEKNVCTNVDEHVNYLINKTELNASKKKEKFKPYHTTLSNVHDPMKEKARKKTKNWEITAATPPPIQHNPTKVISLMESVEIQENYIKKLKELQEKQAAERLLAKQQRLQQLKINVPNDEILKTHALFNTYRSKSDKPFTSNIAHTRKLNEDKEKDDDEDISDNYDNDDNGNLLSDVGSSIMTKDIID